ncbi:MAG: hypothetical protein Tsb0034_12920 [Ekhidna sp.]
MSPLWSQQGDFLLTQHFPQNSNIDNSHFELTSDSKGRICIANRSGILKYDGEAWDFYQTPSAALSLAVDEADVVYVGCIGSVGLIDFNDRRIEYNPIFENDSIQDLFLETVFASGKVYFMGSKNLIVYDIENQSTKKHPGNFLNLYTLGQEVFINTESGETFRVSDMLEKVTMKKKIAYSSQKEGLPDLIIDFEGNISSYTDETFKSFPQNKLIAERGYEIQEIQWINDSLFVCSTFESGLLFFNNKKPKEITVTDYHSGLPDNEVYALHTDQSNGVWAAHAFGITQISPLFPAYSFSHFPGLEGNLTSVSYHQGELWVTTSLGLFYFDQDTIFENKVYYEVVENRASRPAPVQKQTVKQEEEKPLLKRLFGKKSRASESNEEKKGAKGLFKSIADLFEDNIVDQVKGKLNKNARYVRKVSKIPLKIKYNFKKIDGSNGRFIAITEYEDRLLAIGTGGVFEIEDKEAHVILPVSARAFTINSKKQLIISTNELEVKLFKLIKDVWVEQVSESTNDIIVNMREDADGTLWLAGSNNIYKAASTDSTFSIQKGYELNNLYLDDVNMMKRNGALYLVNAQGYFYYDKDRDKVIEDEELYEQIGVAQHHLPDPQQNSIWSFTGKAWHELKADGSVVTHEYLGLFPDLNAISTSFDQKYLWLITEGNDILKYDPDKEKDFGQSPLFLRSVSNENGEFDQRKKFSLSYDENFLYVELSKPDYLGLLNPEFQYKLVGLHSEWSDWTKNKSIDFSFLPEGNYSLHIRARDAFGRIEEAEMLEFSVRPPYWQTPWFYAIQIIFFGALVYFSSKLNQDNTKNRLLSGALTLLTLVLIIEFLQSAIGSLFTFKSTPVVDFLIDAMIAFMIFPLERLLREIMTKGKVDVKVKIKKEDLKLVRKDSPAK